MDYYAGIDVSLEYSSVCVVDASGKVVREAKVVSEPEALIGWFGSLGLELARIGLEAGPLSQWLYAAMKQAGLAVELLETRHVGDAGEVGPQRRPQDRATDAARLVPAGTLQVDHGPGDPRDADGAQAGAEQAAGPREQPARDFARLRAEGRQDDADKLCPTHRRAGEGASEPSDDRAGATSGAGRSACRVQRF